MEYKNLGNGRVIKQNTPRTSEPLPNETLEMRMLADSARIILAADAIVGSAADVTYGRATHSSIQSAINDLVDSSRILILAGTYTENITVNKRIQILGVGYDSFINGTFNITGDKSITRDIRINGNVTISGNDNRLEGFQLQASSVSNTGSDNLYSLIGV
jgi:hypothetical protein